MVIGGLTGLKVPHCPNCGGEDFMFSGVQKGYGYVSDMELWTCRSCYSTFSERSLYPKATRANRAKAPVIRIGRSLSSFRLNRNGCQA